MNAHKALFNRSSFETFSLSLCKLRAVLTHYVQHVSSSAAV